MRIAFAAAVLVVCPSFALGEGWSADELAIISQGGERLPLAVFSTTQPRENELLRRRAAPVSQEILENPEALRILQRLVARMVVTAKRTRGVGIAAPQVGISRQLFVARDPRERHETWLGFVNPSVMGCSQGQDAAMEACLSVPGRSGKVWRPLEIHLSFTDVQGNAHPDEFFADAPGSRNAGFARILQHELDHLEGVLFVDRVTSGFVPLSTRPGLGERF